MSGLENVMNKLGTVGKADAIVSIVDKAEETQTGQLALQTLKGGIILIGIIVIGGIIMFVRTTNRMFGTQKKELMSVARPVSLEDRLSDYFKAKYPKMTDTEIHTKIKFILQ